MRRRLAQSSQAPQQRMVEMEFQARETTGAALSVETEPTDAASGGTTTAKTICPHLACFGAAGLIATVEDGKITRITGDKAHPTSEGYTCHKARTEWEILYHPDRITQPMLKVDGEWQAISADEAIDIAAGRLHAVREKYGPLAFAGTQCVPSVPEGAAMILYLRSLGSPNATSNIDLCGAPALVGDWITFGEPISIYQVAQDFKNAKCVMLAGSNMAITQVEQWFDVIKAKRRNGAKVIVIDPRPSETTKHADIWLKIRPGTDLAFALGLLNVVINEGLYDAEFVEKYCVGFDQVREHVQQYTPEMVSQITTISAEHIVEVARIFATSGASCFRGNCGVFQHPNSTQTTRAFGILSAITGNVDRPGTNLLVGTPPPGYADEAEYMASTRLPREVEEQMLGAQDYPLWYGPDSMSQVAHNGMMLDAMLTHQPYPIKSLATWMINPVLTYPGGAKVQEALDALDFHMIFALTPGPTSAHADLILPQTHLFEQKGTWFSRFYNTLSGRPKLVDPPEGCRDVVAWLHDILEKMVEKGYIEKNLIPWKDLDTMIEARFAKADFTFQDLCAQPGGVIHAERHYEKFVERGFRTPSGKIELYSSRLEELGLEPLPVYRELFKEQKAKTGRKYPLMLTTRRSKYLYCTRGVEIASNQAKDPYPVLFIHTEAARERGIVTGDLVAIMLPRGEIRHVASVTDEIHPEVVSGAYPRYVPQNPSPGGDMLETNVNKAMSYNDDQLDPETGIPSVQGLMCQVRKVEAATIAA